MDRGTSGEFAGYDMKWLLRRLREPSTWRGIIWIATSVGVTLSPEVWEYIITAGMALAGLVGVLTREKEDPPEVPPIDLVSRSEPERVREPELPSRDRPPVDDGRWRDEGFNG